MVDAAATGEPEPVGAEEPASRRGTVLFFVVLGALVALVYLPSARTGFFADDFGYLNATLAEGWWHHGEIWDFGSQVLRPVTVIAIGVQHEVFGYRPFAFHLVTMALVLAQGVLVWALVRRLGGGELAGRAAAAVVALHTMNGYTIAWTASTSSNYGVLFGVAAVYLVATEDLPRRRAWAAAGVVVVALLSREVAMVVPVVVTLVRYHRQEGAWRPRLRAALSESAPVWTAFGAWLALRLAVSGYAKLQPERPRVVPILDWASFTKVLPDAPRNLWELLMMAVSPFRFTLDDIGLHYPWWVVVIGLVTWAAIVALVVREWRAGRHLAAVGLAWFVIGILPPAFLQLGVTYVNYVDFALPGLALAIGAGLEGWTKAWPIGRRRLAGAVALAVLAWVTFNGANLLFRTPPPIITRPAAVRAQLLRDHPVPPPPGSVVVITGSVPEDFLWTSKGDLVRVLWDDPTLRVEFDPPPPGMAPVEGDPSEEPGG